MDGTSNPPREACPSSDASPYANPWVFSNPKYKGICRCVTPQSLCLAKLQSSPGHAHHAQACRHTASLLSHVSSCNPREGDHSGEHADYVLDADGTA